MKSGDFERIDVKIELPEAGHFILIPTEVKLRDKTRVIPLEQNHRPLSFHEHHQGKLWKEQIERLRKSSPDDIAWATKQLRHIVSEHAEAVTRSIKEEDLLRGAGALSLLGLDLSAYVGDGYDCPKSQFQFNRLPPYHCPVEVKKRSSGFKYQMEHYDDLPRAVVLCVRHDLVNPPDHVDVLELTALAEYLSR